MKLIECVPNFSEGRDPKVIATIREAIAAVPGVSVLHTTSDASHHRSVITFVAPYEAMADAAFAAIRTAQRHVDLTKHEGVHPRIGATDVMPFIPLDGATMEDCIALANTVGERVGRELEIPVYLYERAAKHPARQKLEDVRRGGFEGLLDAIVNDPARAPDYGPSRLHPTAGAVVIGARPFLVAFNVYIGDATQLPVAKAIAKAIRTSSGGLPAVKALGLEVDGQAQVSMNLVDVETTSLSVAFEAVRREAVARGASVTWSEIIGLVPERVAFDAASQYLRLRHPIDAHVLERHVLATRETPSPLPSYVDAIADASPTPGGGSVAATTGAFAAALVQMAAGITLGKDRFAPVHDTMRHVAAECATLSAKLLSLSVDDTNAYAKVMHAYALPRSTPAEQEARQADIEQALQEAARVPSETARHCARITALATIVASQGNSNAITDAGTAAVLAEAACQAALFNVEINVRGLRNTLRHAEALTELRKIATTCRDDAERVRTLVAAHLPSPR